MSISQKLYQISPNNISDIIAYQSNEDILDKDIKILLTTGIYKPSYTELVQPYLEQEVQNFMFYFNGELPFNLTINYLGAICNTKMRPCVRKTKQFLKDHHIEDLEEQERFKSNLINECFGNGFICSYRCKKDKKERVYFYDMVENPFYTVYTFAHELTHAMQDKNRYQIYGFTEEKYLRDYKEIHANLTADTFLMIKALQTEDSKLVKETQERLLFIASQMSNVMKTPDLGIRYFEWKGLKSVLADIPKHYKEILTSDGKINWDKLYAYTVQKVEEMDYNPLKVQETKKFFSENVSPLWGKGSKNSEFYEAIKKLPKTNAIFKDFYEGFEYFMTHPKTVIQKMEQFYQKLANPITRKQRLFVSYNDTIPHVDTYRKLYKEPEKPRETEK